MKKQSVQSEQPAPRRLQSLDALRGFDMLFIMGGAALFAALATLMPCSFFDAVAEQMEHVEWNGLRHHDTIFPLFLFIAGISFPFSLEKQRMQGKSETDIWKKVIRRGLTLVLLGCIYNGLLDLDFANQRYASVLGRIGLAWMFAALLFMKCAMRTRIGLAAGILVGYWLLLAFVPAPDGGGADPFSMEGCLVGYVDRLCLPGRLHKGIHDPEGILSILPSIVTAMLGMFTGEFIKWKNEAWNDRKKVVAMLVAGVALLVVGLVWSLVFPINKNLWTSTFVCVVGSYSVIMFALFYYVVDVLNYRKWTLFFRVIGMNSITIYMANRIMGFGGFADFFFGGFAHLLPPEWGRVVLSAATFGFGWLFLLFLYRRKVFLRV